MPPDYVSRQTFEAYVDRHDEDAFAHGPLVDRAGVAGLQFRREADSRLTALERWQQRIIGGLFFASVLLGSGAIAVVIEFARK